jgi:NAD(P)-dependent dehydrogenase (short-subunit alcohol dehydrogenase family)
MSEEGAAVAVLDLDEEGGERVAEKLTAVGSKAAFFACDVTREEDVSSAISSVTEQFGRYNRPASQDNSFHRLPLRLVFSEKLGLLHPAPHTRLVVQVLLPEGAFQITLLAPDHLTLDHEQRQR